jgi:hypothetical protein
MSHQAWQEYCLTRESVWPSLFHIFIGVLRGEALLPVNEGARSFFSYSKLGLRVLGATGNSSHVPIISEVHWVVVGWGPVDLDGIFGTGAVWEQNYSSVQTQSLKFDVSFLFKRRCSFWLMVSEVSIHEHLAQSL